MGKVLVLDDIVPIARIGYGYARAKAILDRLCALGYSPTLIPISGLSEDPYGETNRDYSVLPIKQAELGQVVRQIADDFDAVFVSRPRNLKLLLTQLDGNKLNTPIIYDSEAINALRTATQAAVEDEPLSRQERNKLLADEMAMIAQVDRVASVSDFEAALVHEWTGIVPTVLGHFHDETATSERFEDREGLLFLGSYFRVPCPNLDAAAFLADQIVPELQKRGFDPHIRIAGFKSERAAEVEGVRDCSSISIVGTLTELKPEYERARLVIIPTRIAAGIAYKYTEALNFGVPCVASKLICDQIPCFDNLLPGCKEPAEFAEQIVLLYNSKEAWSKQRDAGLAISDQHFSRNRFDNGLRELIG